jgi:hypothetical protein
MPVNRVDPEGMPMSAAEFRAAGLADRKKAMAEYVARQAVVDARTAELRRLRLAAETHAIKPSGARNKKRRERAEERRPDLFMAGDAVKRRVGI